MLFTEIANSVFIYLFNYPSIHSSINLFVCLSTYCSTLCTYTFTVANKYALLFHLLCYGESSYQPSIDYVFVQPWGLRLTQINFSSYQVFHLRVSHLRVQNWLNLPIKTYLQTWSFSLSQWVFESVSSIRGRPSCMEINRPCLFKDLSLENLQQDTWACFGS